MPVKNPPITNPGGGISDFQRYSIAVSSDGQTVFPLPNIPPSPGEVLLLFEGIAQEYGADKDYEVTGNQLIWKNRNFSLSIGNFLDVQYFI